MAKHSTQRNFRRTLMHRHIAAWEIKNGRPMPMDARPSYLGSGWFQVGSKKVRTKELSDILEGMDIYELDRFYSENHT